jgi:uncharacterized protein HemX
MFSFKNNERARKGTTMLTVFAVLLSIVLIAPLVENSYSVQHEQKMMQNRTHQMLQNQTDKPLMRQEQKMMQNRTHQMLQNQTDNPLMLQEQKMMQNRTHQMSPQ